MSSAAEINLCIYCNKECKSSDSRSYPSSKSKTRIHNRCSIKKMLADKRLASSSASDQSTVEEGLISKPLASSTATATQSLIDRMNQDEEDMKKAATKRALSKLAKEESKATDEKNKSSGQFFFDLKAGIAKPHEKKRYLTHRNLSEIVTRFDDNGFQEEAIGRSYDHTGKDLNTLGDTDESDSETNPSKLDEHQHHQKQDGSGKRKFESRGSRGNLVEQPQSRVKLDEKNPCWFCLSSPIVEKHLIFAIGDYCYLTLAKGGLVDEHFLILPIEHIHSLNSDDNSKELLLELENFKTSFVRYFSRKAKGVVFFERNFRSAHWQLQVVPIPLEIIDTIEEDIKSISKANFKNSDYLEIPASCSLSDIVPPSVPYFFWQLEPLGKRMVTKIQVKGSFFPIQLGRIVLANENILNCCDRVDWKTCVKTVEEYADLVKQTKENYREFDIT